MICSKCGHRMIEDKFKPEGSWFCSACDHERDQVQEELRLEIEPPIVASARPDERSQLLAMLRRAEVPYMAIGASGPDDEAVVTIENLELAGLQVDVVFKFRPLAGTLSGVEIREG